jgi:hypothetical protein
MARIIDWLNSVNFDWATGKIIVQDTEGDSPGWSNPTSCRMATQADILLNLEFSRGCGGPECPRFIAEDKEHIYFPSQYDGATDIEVVSKDINKYLDITNPTPYPGG